MGHSAAVWDYKAAVEMTKDWNGIDHVVLRSPQGASVRVGIVHFTLGWLSWDIEYFALSFVFRMLGRARLFFNPVGAPIFFPVG